MKTAAVVTTHNEAPTIAALVTLLRLCVDDVIVIDEDSTDETRELALQAGARVYAETGGIGPCQRHGWVWAMMRGADRIVQIDAGGSHDAGYIPHMLTLDADIVIGSRFVAGARHEGAWWRSLGSRAYGWLWRVRTHAPIRDWTSGYRVFTRHACEVLLKHDYTATMHGWQAEALAYAVSDGLTVVESPTVYTPSDSSLSWEVTKEAMRGWLEWKP